ncbi:MAG: F0F1 ATP synthase subunit gamma, partial [Candidatus Omnitrophica bacterium]|nr:F0F1 ATP synthase subunit gamma [Candidatus Omnitrophota bacterium]
MPTLVRLREDLNFNRNLGDIIDTLKSAALIQFRLFQTKISPNENFLKEIEASFKLLEPAVRGHPYLVERQGLQSAIVIITSDEGFLGEMNSLLINAGLEARERPEDEIIIIGDRGAKYLEEMEENFVAFPGISEDIKAKDISALSNYLLKGYHERFRRILIAYPEFVSLTLQKVRLNEIFPYQATDKRMDLTFFEKEVEVEPSAKRLLENLMRLYLEYRLFEIFWSSKQSEYAARIMHLEGSTQELSHMNQRLAFNYFRQVHAVSDKTIREISASRIFLRD